MSHADVKNISMAGFSHSCVSLPQTDTITYPMGCLGFKIYTNDYKFIDQSIRGVWQPRRVLAGRHTLSCGRITGILMSVRVYRHQYAAALHFIRPRSTV